MVESCVVSALTALGRAVAAKASPMYPIIELRREITYGYYFSKLIIFGPCSILETVIIGACYLLTINLDDGFLKVRSKCWYLLWLGVLDSPPRLKYDI